MSTLRERTPDISVIIPVYNLEHHITPMLDSLASQDLGEYKAEIIFVLNNCTDDSEGVIRRSGTESTIINCTIQGCGPARNAALDIATGEYVWFMDGDDWLLSDTAIRDCMDKVRTERLNILRVPFRSATFRQMYFSMVWQYVLRMEFVKEFRFPEYQPSEDDAYMRQVLYKAGVSNHMTLPHMARPLYLYNYMRDGSNMYRHAVLGEKI